MKLDTFYTDHWQEIEPDRMAAYEKLFQWDPAMAPLLEPGEFGAGQAILDFGCGPGFTTLELAKRAGPDGVVRGVDINADMVASANGKLAEAGVGGFARAQQHDGARLPFDDGTFDRVLAKNVLEYLDDPVSSLREFHRVLKPGGKAHITDSDWGLFLIEPLSLTDTRKLVDAARYAYKTPLIGRKLLGFCRVAGFSEVNVQILARPDLAGRLLIVARNLSGYAVQCGTLDQADADAMIEAIERGLDDGTYFAMNPQFLVTADR